MSAKITFRLIVSAFVVFLVALSMHFTHAGTPKVTFPTWSVKDLPAALGDWTLKQTELDPKIFARTEATVAQDYIFVKGQKREVYSHLAMFESPETGVWHSPPNCYRGAGWQRISAEYEDLSLPQGVPPAKVCVEVWEQKGSRCTIVYWFQLGPYDVYDRWSLGVLRILHLGGKPVWPPEIKVLLSVAGAGLDERKDVLDVAKEIHLWLNQPSHKDDLDFEALAKKGATENKSAEQSSQPEKSK